MAFHIPFEHRNRNRNHIGPIYIGFDEPARRPRKKFNWWGFHGLWLSLVSFLSAGFLSPISLIISLVGLRRKGARKMAAAGTFFSLIGIGTAALFISAVSHDQHQDYLRRLERQTQIQVDETKEMMASATEELEEYRDGHDGVFPKWVDCNMLMIKYEDPWGNSLRFDADADDYGTLRSAGADAEYDTADDLTVRVEGQTDRSVLLGL